MLRGGLSEHQNGALMKMFHLIGYGERAGSGVPNIYATWDNAGYAAPTVEEQFGSGQPNRTIVTLPLVENTPVVSGPQPEKQPEKSLEIEIRSEQVLSLIIEKPSISQKELSERLQLTEQQVRTVIENLKSKKVIYREGPDKSGKWIINSER